MPDVVAGFVLAGGRSSRMGTDKAGLFWNGQSLLDRAVGAIQAVTGKVAIIGNPAIHLSAIRSDEPVPVISDRFPGAGPLAGIEAALAWSPAPWNLIVACDMPALDPRILRAILERALGQPECDAVVPISAGRTQPLCAGYHQRALPTVRAALEAGTFKVMDALNMGTLKNGLRVGHIEVAAPDSFRNVNTPEDWNSFISAH